MTRPALPPPAVRCGPVCVPTVPPSPDARRVLAAALAWRIERTALAPMSVERMEAATVRPGEMR